MEQGFFLAKELNISWSDMQRMDGKERRWLLDRLAKHYEDEAKHHENEMRKVKSGGSGLSLPVSVK